MFAENPAGFARQCFHDLNVLGVRPNAALAISMDARDPVTAVTRAVATEVPFFNGRVNEKSRQLKRADPQVVTLSALRGACVTFMLGIGGVKFGAKPVTGIEHGAGPRKRNLSQSTGSSRSSR